MNDLNNSEKQLAEENARLRREIERLEATIHSLSAPSTDRQAADFRAWAEAASIGIFLLSDGRFIYANAALAELIGMKSEDLLKEPCWEMAHPDDVQLLKHRYAERQAGREVPLIVVTRILKPDGKVLWIQTYETPYRYHNVETILGFVIDVTYLIESEKRLAVEEERYRTLVEAAKEAIFTVDRQGVFLFMNAEAARQLGGDPRDFVGRSQWQVFPQALADRQMKAVRAVFETGEGFSREVPTVMPGGGRGFHHTTGVPIRNLDGQIVAVLCIARDVTDLVQARNALSESEAKYSRLLENLPIGVFQLSGDLTLTAANDALIRMYGFDSLEECLRAPAQNHMSDMSQWDQIQHVLDEAGFVRDVELEVRRKDGTPFWVSLSARVRTDRDGRRVGVDGAQIDITKRKKAQEELRLQSLVLDQISDHVSITDFDGVITYVNQAVAGTHLRSKQEMIGQPTTIYGEDPVKGTTQLEIVEKTRRDGYWRGEVTNYAGDGSEIVVDLRTQVVHDEQGKPIALCGIATNITAAKRAESALSESEQLFRVLAESAPAVIIIFQDDRIVYANRQLLDIFNLELPDLEGMKFWELMAPEFRDKVRQLGLARQQGEVVPDSYEVRVVTPGGQSRWALFSGRRISYKGRPAGLGVAVDITERKETEIKLRESEELFRAVADTAPVAIVITQGDKIVYANRSALGSLELEAPGLRDRHFWDFFHPEDQQMVRDFELKRQSGAEVPPAYEARFYTQAGEERWGLLSGSTISYRGKPAALGIGVDITERKLMEERLRESEERFRRIVDRSFDTIVNTDTDGVITYASPAAEKLAGYKPEQIIGRHISEFVPQAHLAAIGKALATVALGRAVEGVQYEFVAADGRSISVESNITPIVRDDRVVGSQAIMRDIAARKQAEKMLEEAHNDQSRQLRQVAGGLAHDIYNDLFPVSTSLYKLRQRFETSHDPDKSRDLRLLQLSEDAINRAVRLTESVSLYSRLQRDKVGNCADLKFVLSSVLEHNRDRISKIGVRVDVDVPDQLLVGCVQQQLHSLLNNLLLNALDALEAAPERTLQVSARLVGEQAAVEFRDSGGGIPADILPRIFEPFFSTKPNTGTGLGLAIVKRIVDVCGGTITVQSALDTGTTFSILLPTDVGTS